MRDSTRNSVEKSNPRAVETRRLLLRPFQSEDSLVYERIRANSEVARYLPGGLGAAKHAAERAVQTIQLFTQLWQERGFGPWAVIEKQSQALLGHCGLRYLPEFKEVEVLYALDTSAWGKGFATEAAQASVEYGFTQLELKKIIALALPENQASRRVMERIGMRYVQMTTFKGYEVVYYELYRPQPVP